ncbi:hypothetical protein GLOIN_2v1775009 [Rhizophagus irregularis DAOM 181602=DAOM 197198]|nr:hypothetical protein GLOIN_2v1775009 [Rhizophagus irregularis DAOM 181602=DAOM 197198]
MCLYCATKKYKCTITKPPNRGNRTTVVKNAYTAFIIPSPNWAKDRISFIQEKVSTYNYSVNLKKTFNFLLCSCCNSSLQRLTTTKAKKSINFKPTFETMQISHNMQSEPEVYDLTITEKETTLQNSLERP